ncbi:MAG: TIGR02266 family protein [Nannocystaceae bacterium]|nr:TIGR02266 family protein [Nannocystaceae bacterium]
MGGEEQDDDPERRRRAPRASVVLQLQYRSASHLLVSYCTNLSRGGLFVPTSEPLSPGARLTVTLQVPGTDELLEAQAEVRWVRQFDALEGPAGMGLAFDEIDDVLGDRIDDLVAQYTPLSIAVVGEHAPTLDHVQSLVRTLVSCETRDYTLAEAVRELATLRGADLVIVDVGNDVDGCLGLLRALASGPRPTPRMALCDARNDVRARVIGVARVVGLPIDPVEARDAVLESVAQVDAQRFHIGG